MFHGILYYEYHCRSSLYRICFDLENLRIKSSFGLNSMSLKDLMSDSIDLGIKALTLARFLENKFTYIKNRDFA